MTDSRPAGAPQAKPRPWRRLKQTGTYYGLGAGVAIANAGIRYERVPVFGNAVLTVRIKTATAGGTVDIVFGGPDVVQDEGDVAFASAPGTKYTTGNPAQVTVTAGTEAIIQAICFGDGFAYIKFTGGGTGTITFCDVSVADASVDLAAGAPVSVLPTSGGWTDRSAAITVGGTAQALAAAVPTRKYFFFENLSAENLWIDFGATAVADKPSIKVAPGFSFVLEASYVNNAAISVIGATTGSKFTAKEA